MINVSIVNVGWSETPIPKHAFDIAYVHVSTPPGPTIGDTIYLTVKFVPNYTGTATFRLHFQQCVVPPDYLTGTPSRDSLIAIDSGTTFTDSIALCIRDSGSNLITFSVFADSATATSKGLLSVASDYVQITKSITGFKVRYSDDPGDDALRIIGLENRTLGAATLCIEGRVFYTTKRNNGEEIEMGVPKVVVYATFTYHGQVLDPFSTPFSYTAKTDENGYFLMQGNGPAFWPYETVLLYVGQQNDAALLLTRDYVTWAFGSGTMRTFPGPDTKNYPQGQQNEGLQMPVGNTNHIYYNGQRIQINKADGQILRNMQLSQDFDAARGMTVPGGIAVYNGAPGPNNAGVFSLRYVLGGPNAKDITIDSRYTELATCAHEWGHWFNCNTWYSNYSDFTSASSDLKEGWAEFHQFATRNWVASTVLDGDVDYGESWDDNQEEAPFNPIGRLVGVRYYGSTYAPNAAAFSCYLWNLYDKYTEANFLAPKYQGSDNDDIGIPFDVYNTLENGPLTSISAYQSAINSGKSSELTASMNKIYSSMLDDSNPMRPAQVKNLSGWVNEMPGRLDNNFSVHLTWTNQEYTTGTFINERSGVNIYQSDGSGGWNLIATTSAGATGYSMDIPNHDVVTDYKVSSENTAGDSYDAPTVTCDITYKTIQAGKSGSNPDPSFLQLESAYPNPFNEWISINMGLKSAASVRFELLSNGGAPALSGGVTYDGGGDKILRINSASLISGTYTLRVTATDGQGKQSVCTREIVKMH